LQRKPFFEKPTEGNLSDMETAKKHYPEKDRNVGNHQCLNDWREKTESAKGAWAKIIV
jgi:hypothetical protein